VSVQLGDDLARVLAEERLGLSGTDLVQRVRRRRGDVLACLRGDPRFQRVGNGRGARWTLDRTRWGGLGREDREQARVRIMLDLRGAWWGL
jgi:hypothetical protein